MADVKAVLITTRDPDTAGFADKTAELDIVAARPYNRGLRAICFGLATVTGLGGPEMLAGAAIVTLLGNWWREFASQSRMTLLEQDIRTFIFSSKDWTIK